MWYEYDDRWTGFEAHFDKARAVGKTFDLKVIGVYASTQESNGYPMPRFTDADILVMLYETVCCPSCSGYYFRQGGGLLRRGEDFTVWPGKRFDMAVNQRRILKEWRQVFGEVDYSNRPGGNSSKNSLGTVKSG